MTNEIPETLTDRVLVQRTIALQRPKTEHSRPRWALTKDLFLVEPAVARAICYRYGFDPDKEIYPFNTIV